MSTEALQALSELVAVEDLERSFSRAAANANQFQIDVNYAIADALATELGRRKPLAWAAARAVLTPGAGLADGGQAVAMLSAQDQSDLERLNDLFNDGMPYDLPKERMQRLAKLGVIRHVSGGYYAITAFGSHCIDPEWGLPLRTAEQINADQAAAIITKNGLAKKTGESA